MATLKDVAERAGVSISTASYVLNGKKKVREDTYERIMRAVRAVGYVPNQMARGLKTRRSGSIGVIVPDISNAFFPEIVRGIEDTVSLLDYSIILCNTDNDADKERKYINTLIGKDIDGMIFIGTAKSQEILKVTTDRPIVLVDRKLGDQFCSVTTDNYRGGYLATAHLLACGYRVVGMVTGPLYARTFHDRLSGYMDALKAHGLHYDEELVIECDVTDTASGYAAAKKLRGLADGIFAATDLLAMGAVRALLEDGVDVPQQAGVVGYDDISLSAVVMPAITTVSQPKHDMGSAAARLLLERIEDAGAAARHLELQPSLVVRDTTVMAREP